MLSWPYLPPYPLPYPIGAAMEAVGEAGGGAAPSRCCGRRRRAPTAPALAPTPPSPAAHPARLTCHRVGAAEEFGELGGGWIAAEGQKGRKACGKGWRGEADGNLEVGNEALDQDLGVPHLRPIPPPPSLRRGPMTCSTRQGRGQMCQAATEAAAARERAKA
jgi:hypothetical protein